MTNTQAVKSQSYRAIIHADFDAFYASVEQRDDPSIAGKPVLVGGSAERRGVVASASYEAREFGIRSAMPMSMAMRLCPYAIRRAPRFDVYRQVSKQVMNIFREITPLVEPLSLDEAYLDVTDHETKKYAPPLIARDLKRRIENELNLTISVGVATSKSVAKIASELDKPNGLTVVRPGTEPRFLSPLAVERMWGIGPKTRHKLNSIGIETIGDLAKNEHDWFRENFGSNGESLRLMCLGIDDRPVNVKRIRKSYSSETTLTEDTDDPETLREVVSRLSHDVGRSLMANGMSGKTVKLKLRSSDFLTFTRQKSFTEAIHLSSEVAEIALDLLKRELTVGEKFRLVGVGVSGFDLLENAGDVIQLRLSGF